MNVRKFIIPPPAANFVKAALIINEDTKNFLLTKIDSAHKNTTVAQSIRNILIQNEKSIQYLLGNLIITREMLKGARRCVSAPSRDVQNVTKRQNSEWH